MEKHPPAFVTDGCVNGFLYGQFVDSDLDTAESFLFPEEFSDLSPAARGELLA